MLPACAAADLRRLLLSRGFVVYTSERGEPWVLSCVETGGHARKHPSSPPRDGFHYPPSLSLGPLGRCGRMTAFSGADVGVRWSEGCTFTRKERDSKEFSGC